MRSSTAIIGLAYMNLKNKGANMNMTEQQQMNMFGCLLSDLDADIQGCKDDLVYSLTGFAMSVLSDAQEQMAMGLYDKSRQYINIAKYIIKQMED
jgi:hypothetical protein